MAEECETAFYLTGGTALGRHYLNHRYSDDLDFFVNASPDFKKEAEKMVQRFQRDSALNISVAVSADTFLRLIITAGAAVLKVDFINDVPYHAGAFVNASLYKKIDDWKNILSNKISALARKEAKDIADILFLAQAYSFSWREIIGDAKKKDIWVDELAVSEYIATFDMTRCSGIKWILSVDIQMLSSFRDKLARAIVQGKDNNAGCMNTVEQK